jgi:hypothetical protein
VSISVSWDSGSKDSGSNVSGSKRSGAKRLGLHGVDLGVVGLGLEGLRFERLGLEEVGSEDLGLQLLRLVGRARLFHGVLEIEEARPLPAPAALARVCLVDRPALRADPRGLRLRHD